MTSGLAPVPSSAETDMLALWSHIFGGERGYVGLFSGKRGTGPTLAEPRQTYYAYPQVAGPAVDWLRREAAAGREVYFCAHLLSDKRRVKANAAPMLALYVDGDGAQIRPGMPEPTAIVNSSPGRQHFYWRLSEPVPPAVGEQLNRRLATMMGADRSGWDLTQLLRPPGVPNQKYEGGPLVELAHLADLAYDAADLDASIPALAAGAVRSAAEDADSTGEPPVRLPRFGREIWRGEHVRLKADGTPDRSVALLQIARVLERAGATRATVVAALAERDATLYQKYSGRADAEQQYNAIVDELRRATAAGEAPQPTDPEEVERPLPDILVSNRELREKSHEALTALRLMNAEHPDVFERGGQLCRVRYDEAGRPHVETLDQDRMRSHLARVANWLSFDKRTDSYRHVSPPTDVAADVLVVSDWGVPALLGLTELPPFRADGGLCVQAGYDPETRLFYCPTPGFALPSVPHAPSADQVKAAAETIDDVIADFPFVNAASRAGAFAAILTVVLRPSIDGNVPLFLIDKPKAGTGASLLADVIAIIGTGRPAAMMGIPEEDEEFDKRITAALADGSPVFVFDNADQPLQSASLARMITSSTYRGRVLGQSKMVDYPQRATVVVTGNNVKLRGDIGRRSIWCRMDAQVSRPWERDGFRHPELLQYVNGERALIVGAALTLARAWIHAGRPDGGVKPLGSFETWTRTIGGILKASGVRGFLSNLGELYELADEGATQWSAFLAALADEFGAKAFSSADVARELQTEGSFLASVLPDDLADMGRSQMQRAIGTAFGKRVDTRFDGRRLIKLGSSHRAVQWGVVADKEEACAKLSRIGESESVSQSESLPLIYEEKAMPIHIYRGQNDSPGLTDSLDQVARCPRCGVDLRDGWCPVCQTREQPP